MGDGINVSRGVTPQPPVQDAGVVEEAKPKDITTQTKADAQPAPQPKDKPVADSSTKKQEQNMKGTQRQAELSRQLENKTQSGESIKSAEKILGNSKLSDQAKIAELQKVIEKTDKNEFKTFMAKYPNLSMAEKALINSAITESPKIMERVAGELSQSEQLTVVWNGVMDSTRGKNPAEESKRQERTDKAIMAWMKNTDPDTLNKALDGKSIDFRASAKLYGTLMSDPARAVVMGQQGRLIGDPAAAANELMNLTYNNRGPVPSRQDIESMAASIIVRQMQDEARKPQNRMGQPGSIR